MVHATCTCPFERRFANCELALASINLSTLYEDMEGDKKV